MAEGNAVGRADYSTSDFVENVKYAYVREAVPFDYDIFNELVGQARICEFSGGRGNLPIGAW